MTNFTKSDIKKSLGKHTGRSIPQWKKITTYSQFALKRYLSVGITTFTTALAKV